MHVSLGIIPDAMRLDKEDLLKVDRAARTIDGEAAYILGRWLSGPDKEHLPDLLDWLDRSERLILLHAVRAMQFFAAETACVDNPLPPLPKHRGWDLASIEQCFNRIAAKVRARMKEEEASLNECVEACRTHTDNDLVGARILDAGSLHLCRVSRFADLCASLTVLAGVCRIFKMNPALLPPSPQTSDA